MDKIKITNHQVFTLTASFSCGSGILIVGASMAGLAKQDAWISVLMGMLLSVLYLLIICYLWGKFPGRTYVEIMQKVFGKVLGWIFSTGFVFICFVTACQILWHMSYFITTQAMPETPEYAIDAIFILAIVIALLYGLETIARSFEVFFYIYSFIYILAMVLVLPDVKMENLFPIFDEGIIPILKGTFLLSSYLTFPLCILLMIYPKNAENTKTAKKSLITGFLWGSFLIFITVLLTILVFGSEVTARLQYPTYILAKEVNVGIVISRVEFLTAATWMITLMSRGILYFYSALVGISQLFGIKDHKKIIIPLASIILVMSQVSYSDLLDEVDYDTYVWPLPIILYGLIVPVVMIIVYQFRKRLLKSE